LEQSVPTLRSTERQTCLVADIRGDVLRSDFEHLIVDSAIVRARPSRFQAPPLSVNRQFCFPRPPTRWNAIRARAGRCGIADHPHREAAGTRTALATSDLVASRRPSTTHLQSSGRAMNLVIPGALDRNSGFARIASAPEW